MTYLELVRKYFPTASEKEADDILWQCTPYPMVTGQYVEDALKEISEKSKGDVATAMNIAAKEMDEAMKGAR